MITVENDYEPIVYEQPFSSHIYENLLELLQDYYTRPIRNDVLVEQNVNEINTVVITRNNAQVQITFTKIYKKSSQEKKFGQSQFS